MLLWNVKLFDRVLVTVTERTTAESLVALLNNGTLHGVPGDPAAYTEARGLRASAPFTLATVAQAEPEIRTRRRARPHDADEPHEPEEP